MNEHPHEEERTVRIMPYGADFHLVSQHYTGPTATITVDQWHQYIAKRTAYLNARQDLEIKIKGLKDKKMWVAKNHPD